MSKFFAIDSPFMSGLTKIADLIILNLITAVCCIPVITIGASLTAMHFVALKIVRDEESYIIKTFFRSFKQNFLQSTLLWVIHMVLIGLFVFDFMIIKYSTVEMASWIPLSVVAVLGVVYLLSLHIFPLQSKFENTIGRTIKNSILVGIMTFPKTVLMGVIWIVPVLIFAYVPVLAPILILVGISGPAYLCARLYNKTFKKFEPETAVVSDDEWHVSENEEEDTPSCENGQDVDISEDQI